jgi:hypothetical protein
LLWLDRMLALLDDQPADGGATTSGTSASFRRLDRRRADQAWDDVVEQYGSRFAKDARERPERFAAQCVELLDRFALVRRRAGHVEIAAAASRYRAVASLPTPRRPDRNQQELFG